MFRFLLLACVVWTTSVMAKNLEDSFLRGKNLAFRLVAYFDEGSLVGSDEVKRFLVAERPRLAESLSKSSLVWSEDATKAVCGVAEGNRIVLRVRHCQRVHDEVAAARVLLRAILEPYNVLSESAKLEAANSVFESWQLPRFGFRFDAVTFTCKDEQGASGRNRGQLLECGQMTNRSLTHRKMPRLQLRGIDLSLSDLTLSDLTETILVRAVMTSTRMERTVLNGADLTHANLGGAELFGARLINTVLREADLRGANLRHACVRGSDLSGVKLQGADARFTLKSGGYSPDTAPYDICPDNWFKAGTGFQPLSLIGAEFDDKTLLPFSREEAEKKWGMIYKQ